MKGRQPGLTTNRKRYLYREAGSMLDLRPYGAVNPLQSYSGNELENSDDVSRIGKREAEIDIVIFPAIDPAADLSTDSTKDKLTILITRLMEGSDPEVLRRKYSAELVEDAIGVLENRI